MALEALPGWADEINRRRDHITPDGLNGLLGAYTVTMPLGEALARQQIDPLALDAWVKAQLAPKATSAEDPPSVSVTEALLHRIAGDPRAFWTEFFAQKFGELKITVPAMPRLSAKIRSWIEDWSLLPIFLPKTITQDVYPSNWIQSAWDRHLDPSTIKRYSLPGRWAVVELIRKPDWNDPKGYGNDRLIHELGIKTRFKTSWGHLRATLCPQTTRLWGLKKAAVRPLTAEEWNFFGNILLELNRLHGTLFPDLGATNSWEWTENAYGSADRVIVGNRDFGGLAAVCRSWSSGPSDFVGFRLLGVL
ncbi:hypothetical protein HY630_00365 [Candidatus Uhrbacteria bacterium]|nr:hypothetical protein [Candidatus Uhrbacteria bacterium]